MMDNHYHLLIETPDGNLSLGMRQLNGVYTQLFNKRHQRTGHLFQGRYKSILIQKDSHLLEVCRYVVLNPVRARMVERPEAWKWSSYRATSGREPPPCLTTDWVLGQFSRKRAKAEQEYRQFVEWGIGKDTIWREVETVDSEVFHEASEQLYDDEHRKDVGHHQVEGRCYGLAPEHCPQVEDEPGDPHQKREDHERDHQLDHAVHNFRKVFHTGNIATDLLREGYKAVKIR
jgi:hypothetical protein